MSRKIKSMLIRKGIKQTDIAKALGVSKITVSVVINGYGHSRRIKLKVAEMLNVDYEKLWGKAA